MRKTLSYMLPLAAAFIMLIPPIDFRISAPAQHWTMMVIIAGCLGIRIFFMRANIIVRLTPTLLFISCFFSSAPFLSFNAYISIVAWSYFYIGLTMMDSWKPMFAILKSILVLNCIFLIMQLTGNDQLLNFDLNRYQVYTHGVIGQHMQMGSFSVILGVCLSVIHPVFFLFPAIAGLICNSTWAIFCAGLGLWLRSDSKISKIVSIFVLIVSAIVCINTGKINIGLENQNGRLRIWKESIEMLNRKPFQGWGPGTYKVIFPGLSDTRIHPTPWKTAHNDWIQFAFEIGYILFVLLIVAWLWTLAIGILMNKKVFFSGFIVISVNMIIHFPVRILQCVPLLIIFLAYYGSTTNARR